MSYRSAAISNLPKQIYRMGVAHISTKGGRFSRQTIKTSSVFVNQLLRCSSSIGANIHEAKYAQSRADFISKLEIALKESSETEYWLELLYRKNMLSSETYTSLKNRCGTIRRKLIASVTTAKANSGGFNGK